MRLGRVLAALLTVGPTLGPALAQEGAPEEAPIPEARPERAGKPDLQDPSGATPDEELPDLIPTEATPEDGEEEEAEPRLEETASPSPAAEEPEAPSGPPMREALAETPEELAACTAELDRLGVAWEAADPVTDPDNPDCGMTNPITVSALATDVALEPPSAMRCATALAGARWVADVVLPLGRKLGRGEVAGIANGTAYLCRPRADGEMSEHAWGNALDVMGFRFTDGEPMPVQPRAGDGTMEEAFQRAVRAGACLDFATVLGPGSDADHADHLHLDIRERDGGFRICE